MKILAKAALAFLFLGLRDFDGRVDDVILRPLAGLTGPVGGTQLPAGTPGTV